MPTKLPIGIVAALEIPIGIAAVLTGRTNPPSLVVGVPPKGPITSSLCLSHITPLSQSASAISPKKLTPKVSLSFLPSAIAVGVVGFGTGMGIFELLLGRGLPLEAELLLGRRLPPEVDVVQPIDFGGVPGKWPANVSLRVKVLAGTVSERLSPQGLGATSGVAEQECGFGVEGLELVPPKVRL